MLGEYRNDNQGHYINPPPCEPHSSHFADGSDIGIFEESSEGASLWRVASSLACGYTTSRAQPSSGHPK